MTNLLPVRLFIRTFSFWLLACCAVLSACGGGSKTVGLPSGSALFSNAPSSITLATGASASYTIGGGTPTYSASSSNRDVATATVSGTGVTIRAVAAGSATINLSDTTGAAVSLAVTVSGSTAEPVFFTTAPSAVNIAPGASASFGIGGGKPAYAAVSSNREVATVSLNGANFTINGGVAGTATVNLTDASGTVIALAVTVGSSTPVTPLFTTAPAAVNIAPGASAAFGIGGGRPGYTASSSNAAVASVAVSGSMVTITGRSAGTVQIALADASGAALTLPVTIGNGGVATPLFTSAPAGLTVATGASAAFAIGGGIPAYEVSSSNTAVARVAINGNAFVVTGVDVGTAQIAIVDGAGAALTVPVTVGSGGPAPALYTTAPDAVTVAVGSNATFAVGGGAPAYAISSSNLAVAAVAITGRAISVLGVGAGTATVSVSDANGTALSFPVTVARAGTIAPLFTTAPSAVALAFGADASYLVRGGTEPYAVSSSAPGVAVASLSGTTLSINGGNTGTARITLFDATGTSIGIDVTVGAQPGNAALFTTAAASVSLAAGSSDSVIVGGGTGQYSASSSNTAVARIVLTGASLTITGVSAGTARVQILDSAGAAVGFDVTVTEPGITPVDIFPDGESGNVGDTLRFTISGGTPAYTVSAGNASIASVTPATVSTSGGQFSVRLLNAGNTTITVVDARGQVSIVPVTVGQTSTLLRLAPNAVLLAEDALAPLELTIFGGVGPYRAFTSDQKLASLVVSGSTVTVNPGTVGNRCINPITSDGTYIPNGTFDVTITVLDSLGASALSVITIKDNGAGLGAGCP